MLRVHVRQTGRLVSPFDDPIGDVPIANRPLREWQDRMLAGFERLDTESAPCLSIPDTLYTTPELLRSFVTRAAGRNAVAVLGQSHFGTQTTPVQAGITEVTGGFRFDSVRYIGTDDTVPVEIVLDCDEDTFELDLPDVFGGPAVIPLPRHPMMSIEHWCHILWANQAAGSVEVRSIPRWRGILKVVWAVIRAMSIDKWRVLAKLNTIGKRCDIHPTAVIEGSTIGDDVTIGAFARVVFSRLGDGVTVMSRGEVEASTVGAGATIAQRASIRMCVLYPGAFASQTLMQASILGRDTLTTPASYQIDLNLEGDIRVLHDQHLVSTGTPFLGGAYGHNVRVGTGLWIASGRQVPNGTTTVGPPSLVAAKIQPARPGERQVLTNVDGVLRPRD